MDSDAHGHTHNHTQSRTITHKHTQINADTHAQMHRCTCTYTFAHTSTRTHILTYTHTLFQNPVYTNPHEHLNLCIVHSFSIVEFPQFLHRILFFKMFFLRIPEVTFYGIVLVTYIKPSDIHTYIHTLLHVRPWHRGLAFGRRSILHVSPGWTIQNFHHVTPTSSQTAVCVPLGLSFSLEAPLPLFCHPSPPKHPPHLVVQPSLGTHPNRAPDTKTTPSWTTQEGAAAVEHKIADNLTDMEWLRLVGSLKW